MPSSGSHRGPHAFFTPEELRYIYENLDLRANPTLAGSISDKIRATFVADPKFKEPFK